MWTAAAQLLASHAAKRPIQRLMHAARTLVGLGRAALHQAWRFGGDGVDMVLSHRPSVQDAERHAGVHSHGADAPEAVVLPQERGIAIRVHLCYVVLGAVDPN